MQKTIIQSLYVYPIKSLGAVPVDSIEFGHFGPIDDRRYMLVDEKHRFITQRSHPILSQFKLQRNKEGWTVEFKGSSVLIADESNTDRTLETSVWKSLVQTREKSAEVSRWFSDMLDEWVCLVEFDDLERRTKHFHNHDFPLGFADGFPLLVCNRASLSSLNETLDQTLDMLRFRPNIVVDFPANDEFNIRRMVKSEQAYIDFAEPCVRCNVPAIDPSTSVYNRVLHQSLKTYLSKSHEKPVFGINAGIVGLNKVSVGESFSLQYR